MFLTYQYRLHPTKRQHRALEVLLESQRILFNAALEERIGAWRHGVTRTYVDQTKALTEWRHSDPDAAAIPVRIQRATLKRLDNAYKSFFRRVASGLKPGFPRFRGKGWWRSFGFSEFNGITFQNHGLRFNGMPGRLRLHLHRPIPDGARIRACTFRRDAQGWKVGFCLEIAGEDLRTGNRAVGVDLGIDKYAVLSDGGCVPALRPARRAQRRLRVAQRALARSKQGSRKRLSACSRVAKCHAAIVRARNDFLHRASARLVREYDVVAIEALNVRGLANGPLARDVRDAAWGKFISMLRYKAERAGARLIEVNPRNTSQDCSRCGAIVPKNLDARRHDCSGCGLSIDRDLNAARNVLNRAGVGPGLPNVAGICGMRAGGNLTTAKEACMPLGTN